MADIKWSAFTSAGVATSAAQLVGLQGGDNRRFTLSATPSASAVALWDAQKNLSADNFIEGYTTTATAAGTTVLTVDSTFLQFFTGSTTQTVTLPVASTLVLGQSFLIVNNSTGIVTVQSSGGNTVQALAANTSAFITCILTSGTSAASWNVLYANSSGGGVSAGTQNQLAYYAATGNVVSGLATANNGLLVTSAAGVPSILAGPGTTGNILQSNAAAAPSFSTATYPSTAGSAGTILRSNGTNWVNSTSTFADTYSASNLLYSNGANTVTGLATANSASLVTGSTGVPVWSSTMTNGQVIIGSTGATPTAATLTAGSGISISNGAASITISGTGSVSSVTAITSASSPYTVLSTDQIITTDSSGGAITIRLPNAPSTGRIITIKDLNGSAATNSVTITTVGGVVTIDGSTSMAIRTAYFERAFLFNGTSYQIIYSYYGPIVGAPNNVSTFLGVQAGNSTFSSATGNDVLIGYQAGLSLTSSGTDNTFVGYQAGTAFTTGVGNTIVGSSAGKTFTGITGCTCIGYQAGTLASGNPVTAIGYQAGATQGNAANNTYCGYQAGQSNATGAQVTCFGHQAANSTTVSNTTAIGYRAGFAATTGQSNVFVGNISGPQTAGTATQTVAVGSSALTALTNGQNNTAVGFNAMATVTTNGNNVAVGANAMGSGTSSFQNVAVGSGALQNTTNGNNVGVGFQALNANTSGTGNVAMGQAAVKTITTNSNVTGIGNASLTVATGASNTALGASSGLTVSTGASNVLIGASSGGSLTTGSNNTIVGTSAGSAYTGAEGSDILIGASVTGTVGESNVLRIGSGTGTGTGNLNSAFIHGISGNTQDPTATNKVVTQNTSTQQLGVTIATTTATASALVLRDSNINVFANNFIANYATTVTAGGTTTLTAASAYNQYFTGSSNQTITLPVTSTLAQGFSFMIMNNSTGTLTVNSSGGNLVVTIPSMAMCIVECILTSGTGASSWNAMPVTYGTVTGTGNTMVLSTSPTLVTPTLGAASATSVSFSSTSGIIGTTTNNNAAAGSVGELISSVILSGSAVSLTTATPANVTSISLTAGDWDVWAELWLSANAATLVTNISTGISQTSATLPTTPADGTSRSDDPTSYGAGLVPTLPVASCRISLASTTTVYFVVNATFTVNTLAAYGKIQARRRR